MTIIFSLTLSSNRLQDLAVAPTLSGPTLTLEGYFLIYMYEYVLCMYHREVINKEISAILAFLTCIQKLVHNYHKLYVLRRPIKDGVDVF